jgi:elongation factor Ts
MIMFVSLRNIIRTRSPSRHALDLKQQFNATLRPMRIRELPSLEHKSYAIRCFSSYSSLDLIKDLRSRSGAPITECKKALQSTNDDVDAAMDWLREHGAAKASKKVQGRITNEGLVAIKISDDYKSASIVRIASETDFSGRSSKFGHFVTEVANATLNVNGTGKVSDTILLEAPCSNGSNVKRMLDEVIIAIRENISIVDSIKLTSNKGIFVGYAHNKIHSYDAGMSAAIVEVSSLPGKDISNETLHATGKKLAMHIVAAIPQYLRPTDIPEIEIQKEKDLLTKQLTTESNKSPEIIEKIVNGKIRKFYESVCLVEQQHMIEETNPKVGTFLTNQGIEVSNFIVLSIG